MERGKRGKERGMERGMERGKERGMGRGREGCGKRPRSPALPATARAHGEAVVRTPMSVRPYVQKPLDLPPALAENVTHACLIAGLSFRGLVICLLEGWLANPHVPNTYKSPIKYKDLDIEGGQS